MKTLLLMYLISTTSMAAVSCLDGNDCAKGQDCRVDVSGHGWCMSGTPDPLLPDGQVDNSQTFNGKPGALCNFQSDCNSRTCVRTTMAQYGTCQ